MAVKNNLTQAKPQNFSAFIKSDGVMNSLTKTLGSEAKKSTFVTSIVSAVNQNPQLQTCDFNSIVSGALLGESLKLSPSPQLGHYYLVPFANRKKGTTDAQFQLGYKGYIQLAIRSGQYKKINVVAIKKGELIKYDPLNEEIEVSLIEDEVQREKTETIGYYAMFELVNGFVKALYWSKAKMEQHALQYSKGFSAKKGYTFWEKDFDGMAYKTMLRQLISKWGIMSVDMQNAYTKDMASIDSNGEVKDYVDNNDDYYQVPEQQIVEDVQYVEEDSLV